jgi:hypothetical protein
LECYELCADSLKNDHSTRHSVLPSFGGQPKIFDFPTRAHTRARTTREKNFAINKSGEDLSLYRNVDSKNVMFVFGMFAF